MSHGEHSTWMPGNVGGAWRVGGTVHRPVGAWTPSVHALLAHLAACGIPNVPRVLGFDEVGREVLTFLEGQVIGIETEVLTVQQLGALASWTRRFHEAVRDFEDPGGWRQPALQSPSLIGHNDLGPYNVCFDGDELAGVFDWDLAGPSNPLMELAFMAWGCVPLWRDIGDEFTVARLRTLCLAYGDVAPVSVLAAVPVRIRAMLDWIPRGAAAGDPGLHRLMEQGEPARSQRLLDDLVPRLDRLRSLL